MYLFLVCVVRFDSLLSKEHRGTTLTNDIAISESGGVVTLVSRASDSGTAAAVVVAAAPESAPLLSDRRLDMLAAKLDEGLITQAE